MKVTVKDVAGAAKVLAGRKGMGRAITTPQVSAPELVRSRYLERGRIGRAPYPAEPA